MYQDGLTHDQYSALPGLRSTELPDIWYKSVDHLKTSKKHTPSMLTGNIVHDFFECYNNRETFLEKYATADEVELPKPRNTKEGKLQYAEYMEATNDMYKYSSEEWQNCYVYFKHGKKLINNIQKSMLSAIQLQLNNDSLLRHILNKGVPERSYFGQLLGVDCKARPDVSLDNVFVDFKTTVNAEVNAFTSQSVWKYKYHWSAAFHMAVAEAVTGKRIEQFLWVAIENTEPFIINKIHMPEPMREVAEEMIAKVISKYKTDFLPFLDSNQIIGYGSDIKEAPVFERFLKEVDNEWR